ncbi:hypothetical protein B484DRAFT_459148, partial [Ochromonadaceae sp. CCMP2298]
MFSYSTKLVEGLEVPEGPEWPTTTLLDGSIYLWRTKVCLDIMIIKHNAFGIIEIVSYEPIVDQEAPRIYIRDDLLVDKLDAQKVEAAMKLRKSTSRKAEPDALLEAEAVAEAKLEFIMSHLRVTERSLDPRILTVTLAFAWADQLADPVATNMSEVLIAKPVGLKRFISPHYLTLIAGEVAASYLCVEEDQKRITKMRPASCEGVLTHRERWRIPLIYLRVRRGRFLSNKEARVWGQVSGRFGQCSHLTPGRAKTRSQKHMMKRVTAALTQRPYPLEPDLPPYLDTPELGPPTRTLLARLGMSPPSSISTSPILSAVPSNASSPSKNRPEAVAPAPTHTPTPNTPKGGIHLVNPMTPAPSSVGSPGSLSPANSIQEMVEGEGEEAELGAMSGQGVRQKPHTQRHTWEGEADHPGGEGVMDKLRSTLFNAMRGSIKRVSRGGNSGEGSAERESGQRDEKTTATGERARRSSEISEGERRDRNSFISLNTLTSPLVSPRLS